MNLAKSTYYYHKSALTQPDADESIKTRITAIFHKHKVRYGSRRITAMLQKVFPINHKQVKRIMQLLNIKSLVRLKKYQSYKGKAGKIARNILKRNFKAQKPNQKWVTDVTEFKVNDEKLYLSPILDLYNQEIISYEVIRHPKYELVGKMLNKALDYLKLHKVGRNQLILHSD